MPRSASDGVSAPQGLTVIQVTPSSLPLSCGSMETVHSFALGSLVAHTVCFFRPHHRCPDPATLADHTKADPLANQVPRKVPGPGSQILGPRFIGSDQIGFPTFGLILAAAILQRPSCRHLGWWRRTSKQPISTILFCRIPTPTLPQKATHRPTLRSGDSHPRAIGAGMTGPLFLWVTFPAKHCDRSP